MMMKMRRRDSAIITVFLAFPLFFLIHQITISAISRSSSSSTSPPNSTMTIQEKRSQFQTSHWKVMIPEQPSHAHSAPPPPAEVITCDRTHERYDICTLNGRTTLDPTKSTFYVSDPMTPTNSLGSRPKKHKIRPYPRKWEKSTMSRIKELMLIASPAQVNFQIQHQAPALVFSAGGFTGNLFHDFNDGFIPLFVTVRSIFSPKGIDPVLVISKAHNWWLSKYSKLLRRFTPYPIVKLDNDTATHLSCFYNYRLNISWLHDH